jgi:hypothetical protein
MSYPSVASYDPKSEILWYKVYGLYSDKNQLQFLYFHNNCDSFARFYLLTDISTKLFSWLLVETDTCIVQSVFIGL